MSSKPTIIRADQLPAMMASIGRGKAMKRKPIAPPGARKASKFSTSPVESRTNAEGKVYDSKLEMQVANWLAEMRPGLVPKLQTIFILQPSLRDWADGLLIRNIRYIADFVLGPLVDTPTGPAPLPGAMIIDAKGMETPEFRTKARMFRYRFGIGVTRVKSKKTLAAALHIYAAFERMNQILKSRAADGLPFTVVGYKDSNGCVSTKTMKFVGRTGYLDLVRESRDMLQVTNFPNDLSPAEAVAWHEARTELLESYSRRLGEAETVAAPRQSNETLVPVCDGLALLDGDPDKIVAFAMVEESSVVITPPPESTTKSKPKTVFKRQLERALPISRFVFRLNLYKDNYTEIL